ncbi:MAG TPA: DUF3105 domain-containing protein [Polyangia bacterium]|jgi:hypothetical protein
MLAYGPRTARVARATILLLAAAGCGDGLPMMVTGSGGVGTGGDSSGGAPGSGGDNSDDAGNDDGAGGGADGMVSGADDGGGCNVVVQNHPDEGANHVDECSPVTYATNPPSSGNHYPIWAAYQTYAKPVPWGYLVHDLEHGAVVISYRCPSDPPACNVDLTAVQAFIASQAPDDICLSRKLITLVPDPDLDVAFAASAWTWTLRADCFDATAFGQFVDAHYAHGRERICSQGIDNSATGWCPL